MKQLQTIFSAMVFTGVSLAMTATGAGAGEPGLMQSCLKQRRISAR